jgi:head-tail adaptor
MTRRPQLSRQLTLEERVAVADGSGGFMGHWVGLGVHWAEVVAKTGREDFLAGRARPRVMYLIVVRAAPVGSASRPRPDQRFREGERVFSILTVAEADPAGRYLTIYAEEGVEP